MERFEHYPKQTYRNRCVIYSANGPQTLSIPISRGEELKIHTKDVRIDYATNWQKIHFKAIESAYRCSPFYEFYMDDLHPFFEKKYEFLYDLNISLLNKVLEIIGLTANFKESDDYLVARPNDWDLREAIHPKKRMYQPDPAFNAPVYHQVFEPKFGFISNLSIIDLIFNTGPDASVHLKNSIEIK